MKRRTPCYPMFGTTIAAQTALVAPAAFAAIFTLSVALSACRQTIESEKHSGLPRDESQVAPTPGAVPPTFVQSVPTVVGLPAGSTQPPAKDAQEASTAFARVRPQQARVWKDEWNVFVTSAIDSIGADLISGPLVPTSDMSALCPYFSKASPAQRKAFWALFFASFARYESGYDPRTRFREDASLNHVYSEGLLQLSYGDENNHAGCPLAKAKGNVLDPKANLTCGVAIMKNQLKKKRSVFTASHYYWSVLTNKKAEIKRDFTEAAKGLAFCGL